MKNTRTLVLSPIVFTVCVLCVRQGQVRELSSQRKRNLGDSLLYAQFNRDIIEVGKFCTCVGSTLVFILIFYGSRSTKVNNDLHWLNQIY
ncbi:hypothetical protein DPMN_097339 [Dreissena polymorpha]|uniref:Uncharacterized protein n=1 Tax=Dreissena polymorpha TaxID=45954 RepID=A0A9D4R6A6_DREPO|nr:hypothetical protein DPMN_097339 [Dreissena polymorpha]